MGSYCSHCGKAVKELRRVIDIYPDFSYRLIFSVKSDDVEDKTNLIVRHFINLHNTMNINEFFDMLDAWYAMPNKILEVFQKTFPSQVVQDSTAEIDMLYQFNQHNGIGHTPAILLNGRLLSQLYSYADLFGITRTINAEE